MNVVENISLTLSLVSVILSIAFAVISFIKKQQSAAKGEQTSAVTSFNWMNTAAFIAVITVLLFITLTIISRAVQTGHGPFSNMYEFALAFAWGIITAGLIFRWRYRTGSVVNIGLVLTLLLLIFARFQYVPPGSLVPALQQSALLSAHVASAVIAYGTLTVGFSAAVMYIIQDRHKSSFLPDLEVLDSITYNSVIIGFPFLTLLIVLGALWADIAWGRYWGWDPKETASLVTWLIYAAYMHVRILRGWKGISANILLIAGFLAILLTFFGNYIFTGLHAY